VTTARPVPSIRPLARTKASRPSGNWTPPYTIPEPIELPATAKNCPGGPISVTVTGAPAGTTVWETAISTAWAHAGEATDIVMPATMASVATAVRRPENPLNIIELHEP
jgi:hypothetical protein